MNQKAVLITEEGELKPLTLKGRTFTLEELYELLHCEMVQVVVTRSGMILIVDEEGKLRDKEQNFIATILYANPNDFIVGYAIYCDPELFEYPVPDLLEIEPKMSYIDWLHKFTLRGYDYGHIVPATYEGLVQSFYTYGFDIESAWESYMWIKIRDNKQTQNDQ